MHNSQCIILLVGISKNERNLSLYGLSVSFNYLNSDYEDSNDLLPKKYLWSKDTNDNAQRMYIGYQIGLQYVF